MLLGVYTSIPIINPLFYNEGMAERTLPIDRLNQPVAGGTVLGRVVDPYTLEPLQTLLAPWERGVLMMHKAGIAMVEAGL